MKRRSENFGLFPGLKTPKMHSCHLHSIYIFPYATQSVDRVSLLIRPQPWQACMPPAGEPQRYYMSQLLCAQPNTAVHAGDERASVPTNPSQPGRAHVIIRILRERDASSVQQGNKYNGGRAGGLGGWTRIQSAQK